MELFGKKKKVVAWPDKLMWYHNITDKRFEVTPGTTWELKKFEPIKLT